MNGREFSQIVVRLPRDVKTWLEHQALYNASSQGSEIVRCIRERMERSHRLPENSRQDVI
jgi:hypothetical protein